MVPWAWILILRGMRWSHWSTSAYFQIFFPDKIGPYSRRYWLLKYKVWYSPIKLSSFSNQPGIYVVNKQVRVITLTLVKWMIFPYYYIKLESNFSKTTLLWWHTRFSRIRLLKTWYDTMKDTYTFTSTY